MVVAVARSSFLTSQRMQIVYTVIAQSCPSGNEALILVYHQANENNHIQSSSLSHPVRTTCLSSTAIQCPAPPPRLVALRRQTNAATGYSGVVARIPATHLTVPRVATRADTPTVAVCSADTKKTRPSRQPRSRCSAPSLQRKRPTRL